MQKMRLICTVVKLAMTQKNKQTDRQTDRQTQRQTHRQIDRQTNKQTDRQKKILKIFYLIVKYIWLSCGFT